MLSTKKFKQIENINVTFEESLGNDAKRMFIFFQLPYWEINMLHHSLDVMCIKKNVCENLIYTLLIESERTKYHLNAHKSLQVIGIRKDLWPNDKGKYQP